MLEIYVTILISFIISRLGVMAFDFLSYREVFGWVKEFIASKVDKEEYNKFKNSTNGISKSDGQQKSMEMYDTLSNKSYIISGLDCSQCLTVWASIIVNMGLLSIELEYRFVILVVSTCTAYYLSEKL